MIDRLEIIEIGGNLPPDMTITAGEVAKDLSGWMAEHPMVTTEAEAKEAKVWVDRAYLCLKDLDDERTGKVKPLNEKVKEINHSYRGPCDLLSGVMHECRSRLSTYVLGEETKRRAAAEEAARSAQRAEEAARAAELAEQGALGEASAGVLGVDVAGAFDSADKAFSEYEKLQRRADLAEKEAHVKVGGGFRRAASLRDTEVIRIDDPWTVLRVTGFTEGIKTEILKAARAYKKLRGEYPPGIITTITRGI